MDRKPQPRYVGEDFVQADVLECLNALLDGKMVGTWYLGDFVAVHASPPCQFATDYIRCGNVGNSPNLIPGTRDLLDRTDLPYVIENVQKARNHLREPILLCGSMFDLDVQRHRLFEANWSLDPHPWPCRHNIWAPDRFPGGRSVQRTGSSRGLVRRTVEVGSWDIPLDVQQDAMGMHWSNLGELSQAIPPAYTEFIGRQLG